MGEMIDELDAVVATMPSSTLDELDRRAELMTRLDRKYVVPVAQIGRLVATIADGFAALEIDGSRNFAYRSWYFDSHELASFRSTATGRRQRFKVRTRTYLDAGQCALEVKTRGGRGETIKRRIAHELTEETRITEVGAAFIDEELGRPIGHDLRPVVSTGYRRTTLVALDGASRATVDASFAVASPGGDHPVVFPAVVIVETKTPGPPSALDRAMWAGGLRPARISKFGVAMTITRPELPSNRWHRVLHRDLGWCP